MADAERKFASNAELYEFIDTIAERLRRCDRFADGGAAAHPYPQSRVDYFDRALR